MKAIISIDKAGRVVIPKSLRDAFRLGSGDTLAIESDGERMTLSPVHAETAMRKEHGVWVFRSGQRLPAVETDQALEKLRHDRPLCLKS